MELEISVVCLFPEIMSHLRMIVCKKAKREEEVRGQNLRMQLQPRQGESRGVGRRPKGTSEMEEGSGKVQCHGNQERRRFQGGGLEPLPNAQRSSEEILRGACGFAN